MQCQPHTGGLQKQKAVKAWFVCIIAAAAAAAAALSLLLPLLLPLLALPALAALPVAATRTRATTGS
jgi:hypothetical protein